MFFSFETHLEDTNESELVAFLSKGHFAEDIEFFNLFGQCLNLRIWAFSCIYSEIA